MTFEEIQQTLQKMLAVQKELQESQLKLQESQLELKEAQERDRANIEQILRGFTDLQAGFRDLQAGELRLMEYSQRQQRILDRLIDYSLTNQSQHLDMEEKLRVLENRIKAIENAQSD